MRHTSMNNFLAIDIHTLTDRESYGNVGNGFISGEGGEKNIIPWAVGTGVTFAS